MTDVQENGAERHAVVPPPPVLEEDADECETPPALINAVNHHYGQLTWDVAATPGNSVVPGRFWSKDENARKQDWRLGPANGEIQKYWCNPPYSRPNKEAFLSMARFACEYGRHQVVGLVPANTAEAWFQKLFFEGAECIGTEYHRMGPMSGALYRLDASRCRIDLRFLAGRVTFRNPTMPGCVSTSPHSTVLFAYIPKRWS